MRLHGPWRNKDGISLGAAVSELAQAWLPPQCFLQLAEKELCQYFVSTLGAPPITSEDVYQALSDWP